MFHYKGVATNMIAAMEMQNLLAARPKQTSIIGRVMTRKQSVVCYLK